MRFFPKGAFSAVQNFPAQGLVTQGLVQPMQFVPQMQQTQAFQQQWVDQAGLSPMSTAFCFQQQAIAMRGDVRAVFVGMDPRTAALVWIQTAMANFGRPIY